MSDAYRDWRRRVVLRVVGPVSGELQRYATAEEAIEAAKRLKQEFPRLRYLVEEGNRTVWGTDLDDERLT